jgi:hypothetical protein
VYAGISRERFNLFWFAPVATAPICYILHAAGKLTFRGYLASWAVLLSVPAGRWLLREVRLLLGFAAFRKWRRILPFPLVGWEEAVASELILRRTLWTDCLSVTVEQVSGTEEDARNLAAYMTVLAKRANQCFYAPHDIIPNFDADPRNEWTVHGQKASGSTNREVLRVVYRFLCDELTGLQRRKPLVARVVLEMTPGVYEVPPVRVDNEGSAG